MRAGDLQRGPGRRTDSQGRRRQRRAHRRRDVSDEPNVVGELVNGSASSVAATAGAAQPERRRRHPARVRHLRRSRRRRSRRQIMAGLRVPSIVVAHTVLKHPTPHQRSVLESVMALADQVVVMSEAARATPVRGLRRRPPQGHHHPARRGTPQHQRRAASRPADHFDLGPDRPGQGHRAGHRRHGVAQEPARPAAVHHRRPHPPEGARRAGRGVPRSARRAGGAPRRRRFGRPSTPTYRDPAALTALIQTAAVVVLPYDSKDQVTSGVLVDSIASGRPIVATAFPHAVELLGSGAGTVVAHDDPDALVAALRRLLTDPQRRRLHGHRSAAGWPRRWPGPSSPAPTSSLAQRLVAARIGAGVTGPAPSPGVRAPVANDGPSRHLRARLHHRAPP